MPDFPRRVRGLPLRPQLDGNEAPFQPKNFCFRLSTQQRSVYQRESLAGIGCSVASAVSAKRNTGLPHEQVALGNGGIGRQIARQRHFAIADGQLQSYKKQIDCICVTRLCNAFFVTVSCFFVHAPKNTCAHNAVYFPKEKISKALQGGVVRTTLQRKLSEGYLRRQRADNRFSIHTPRLVFLFEIAECCTKGHGGDVV